MSHQNNHTSTDKRSLRLLSQIFCVCILALLFHGLNRLVLFFEFPYLCNEGIAFGIVLPTWFFILLWGGVMVVLFCLMYSERKYIPWGHMLILSGGIANICDRLFFGCVIDYISLVPWNVFNVADSSIFIGALIILWQQHRYYGNRPLSS